MVRRSFINQLREDPEVIAALERQREAEAKRQREAEAARKRAASELTRQQNRYTEDLNRRAEAAKRRKKAREEAARKKAAEEAEADRLRRLAQVTASLERNLEPPQVEDGPIDPGAGTATPKPLTITLDKPQTPKPAPKVGPRPPAPTTGPTRPGPAITLAKPKDPSNEIAEIILKTPDAPDVSLFRDQDYERQQAEFQKVKPALTAASRRDREALAEEFKEIFTSSPEEKLAEEARYAQFREQYPGGDPDLFAKAVADTVSQYVGPEFTKLVGGRDYLEQSIRSGIDDEAYRGTTAGIQAVGDTLVGFTPIAGTAQAYNDLKRNYESLTPQQKAEAVYGVVQSGLFDVFDIATLGGFIGLRGLRAAGLTKPSKVITLEPPSKLETLVTPERAYGVPGGMAEMQFRLQQKVYGTVDPNIVPGVAPSRRVFAGDGPSSPQVQSVSRQLLEALEANRDQIRLQRNLDNLRGGTGGGGSSVPSPGDLPPDVRRLFRGDLPPTRSNVKLDARGLTPDIVAMFDEAGLTRRPSGSVGVLAPDKPTVFRGIDLDVSPNRLPDLDIVRQPDPVKPKIDPAKVPDIVPDPTKPPKPGPTPEPPPNRRTTIPPVVLPVTEPAPTQTPEPVREPDPQPEPIIDPQPTPQPEQTPDTIIQTVPGTQTGTETGTITDTENTGTGTGLLQITPPQPKVDTLTIREEDLLRQLQPDPLPETDPTRPVAPATTAVGTDAPPRGDTDETARTTRTRYLRPRPRGDDDAVIQLSPNEIPVEAGWRQGIVEYKVNYSTGKIDVASDLHEEIPNDRTAPSRTTLRVLRTRKLTPAEQEARRNGQDLARRFPIGNVMVTVKPGELLYEGNRRKSGSTSNTGGGSGSILDALTASERASLGKSGSLADIVDSDPTFDAQPQRSGGSSDPFNRGPKPRRSQNGRFVRGQGLDAFNRRLKYRLGR